MTRDEAQRILRTIDILASARGWPRSVALEELVYAAAAAEREACAVAVRFADNGTEAAEIIRARGKK